MSLYKTLHYVCNEIRIICYKKAEIDIIVYYLPFDGMLRGQKYSFQAIVLPLLEK